MRRTQSVEVTNSSMSDAAVPVALTTERRRRWLPTALLALLAFQAGSARAGFDHPRGRPDNQLQVDGAPLGRVGDRPAPETVRKLRAQFRLPTNAAAAAKLRTMRTNMMKMIDLLKCEDATIGACLEEQYDEGRICIGFKGLDAARIQNDTSAECNAEPINFPFVLLPCQNASIADPRMVYLFLNALHEAKHGVQDFDAGVGAGDSQQQAAAKTKLKQACNEIDAEDLENAFIDRLQATLTSIAAGNGVPAGATGAVEKIGEEILALPAAARQQVLASLPRILRMLKQSNDKRKMSLGVEKTNYQAFLEGAQSFVDAVRNIRRGRAWQVGPSPGSGSENPLTPLYFGDPESGHFHQTDGDTSQSIDSLLDGTTGGLLLQGGLRLLLVGNDDLVGDGVVLGYEDLVGDGFFDPASRQELIRRNTLYDGVHLVEDPVSDDLLAYNVPTNEIVRLIDTNEDGWPDMPEEVGFADFNRPDLTAFSISEDGHVGYATPINPYGDVLSLPPGLDFSVTEMDIDGFFNPAGTFDFYEQSVYVPRLEATHSSSHCHR